MRQDGSNFEDAEASGGIGLPIPRCHEPAKPGATFSNIQALPEGSRIAHGSTYPFQLSAVERGNGRDGDGSQKLIPGTGSSTVTPVCDMPPAVCFDCICAKIPNLGADAGFLEHGVSRYLFRPEERRFVLGNFDFLSLYKEVSSGYAFLNSLQGEAGGAARYVRGSPPISFRG